MRLDATFLLRKYWSCIFVVRIRIKLLLERDVQSTMGYEMIEWPADRDGFIAVVIEK